jgi:hydrophobic/amphiphilic exporter-1 (mainly G- bacteria), HAE1 family
MNISSFTVSRPVFVSMATLIIMLIGTVSFFRIPIELMPDTSVPTLSISAKYSGAGPTDVEKLVTQPIEDALNSLEGLRYIQSTSGIGSCQIRLVFDWGMDLDEAIRNVSQLIDRVERHLPEEVLKPTIRKYDPNDLPVLVYGVTTRENQAALTRKLEDEVFPILTRIEGVGEVDLLGETDLEVHVIFDLKKLKVLKLSIADVANIIRRENFSMSAGKVQTGLQQQGMRISTDVVELDELSNTIVKSLPTGTVFLSDVATISFAPERRTSLSYVDGVQGLRLAISKTPGANTVKVAKEVQKVIDQLKSRSREFTITEVFNTAVYIERSIQNVNFSVLYGGFLAICVLVIFLRNFRSTLVIGVSIPISVIATFGLIYFSGLSLNLMTIGGLALGIGMLVDNAIVVLENIIRLRQTGLSVKDASIQGGTEVQSSIIASTITTLIVFLPVLFLEGVTSLLFKELAIVVAFAMLVSLASAILLIPTLTSLVIRRRDDPEKKVERGFWGVLARAFDKIETLYISVLKESLQSRAWTIFIVVLLLTASALLIPRIGVEFMPRADSDQIQLSAYMVRGTPMEEMTETMISIENTIKEEFPEVLHTLTFIRDDLDNNRASIGLLLSPPGERKESARELYTRIYHRFSSMPGVLVRGGVPRSPFEPRLPNSSGDLVEIEIRGYDLQLFETVATQVKDALEQIPGIEEIQIPAYRTRQEKLVKIRKIKTNELGIPFRTVADEIRTTLSGQTAGYYIKGGIEYPIRLLVDNYDTIRPEDILSMTLNNRSDEPISFSNIIDIVDYEGPARIEHDNRQRIMELDVDFNVNKGESFILKEMEATLNEMTLPPGFSVVLGGTYQQQKETNRNLMMSLVLVVMLVYMVMAAQFESLKHPFVIMFSVPMAAIGVLWMLYLTGTTFNMQSNMGCVMLAGIVVNNAILLVDQTNALRERKMMPLMEALVEAGRRRLRPILMTTATTVLGLLPLAIGMGEGGEAQAPMARVVLGGLLSSTFITLILVPVIYSLFEGRKAKHV